MIEKEEIKKEDIIGERAYKTKGLEVFSIVAAVVFILLAVLCFAMSESYDWDTDKDYLDPSMIGLGIFCLVLAAPFVFFGIRETKERRQNNRNVNPTIVIRKDGSFVLYHANGGKESLADKIVDVTAGNHMNGKIVFTLEKSFGLRYQKSVRHVHENGMVVIRIKNIISYKSDKHAYSNYEKARLFCAYCGCKVDLKTGKCSSCGGKPAL